MEKVKNSENKEKKSYLKQLYFLLKPLARELILTFFCLLMSAFLASQHPLIIKIIVDDVLINQNMDLLLIMALVYAGIFILSFVFKFMTELMNLFNTQYFTLDLKKKIYKHILNAPLGYVNKDNMGNIVSVFNRDIQTISNFLSKEFLNIVSNLFNIIAIITIMLILNWKLALFVFIVVPLFYLLNIVMAGPVKAIFEKRRALVSDVNNILQDVLGNVKQVKIFAALKYFTGRFLRKQREVVKTEIWKSVMISLLIHFTDLLYVSAYLIIIVFGALLIFQNKLSVGGLIAFFTFIPNIFEPLERLINASIQFRNFNVSLDRIFQYINIQSEINGRLKNFKLKGKVDFKDVSFGYGTNIVLKNITFSVKPGEKIALIGKNGSGKTTLVNLLLKLYPLLNGKIYIDNYNINEIDNEYLRKKIGFVTQQVCFFNLSIKENFRISNSSATDNEIFEACRLTGAHDFIRELPDKYDTVIAEKSTNFSGGQMQKLALARLVLINPEIIIFDEATSSLDINSVNSFYTMFADFFKNSTIIFILHDLNNLIYADRVFLLKNGGLYKEFNNNTITSQNSMEEIKLEIT